MAKYPHCSCRNSTQEVMTAIFTLPPSKTADVCGVAYRTSWLGEDRIYAPGDKIGARWEEILFIENNGNVVLNQGSA